MAVRSSTTAILAPEGSIWASLIERNSQIASGCIHFELSAALRELSSNKATSFRKSAVLMKRWD